MKKIIILCMLILSFFSCSNKKPKHDSIIEIQEQGNNELSENSKNSIVTEKTDIGEEKLQYFGTVYNSFINDDNVNIRSYPSLNADVLVKVDRNTKVVITGVSKEIDNIDNYIGNWLNVGIENHWNNEGWVFSKYVENGQINASKLEIVELSPIIEANDRPKLRATYKIDGINIRFDLYPHKEENQNFYTFAYDCGFDFFHYSNIPGSYVLYPETKELKHLSYIGTDIESAWVIFTDDFKYIIEDFGTGPGPRGLGVWRVEDGKSIFSGTYYKNINLNGNTINIIYVYDNRNISMNRLDDEILTYGKYFIDNNPAPEDMVNYSKEHMVDLTLLIVCKLNLDTNIRSIINGQYIYTQ